MAVRASVDNGLKDPRLMGLGTANIRILVVDDHDIIRRGLRDLLAAKPGWEVCAEAKTGRDAVAMAEQLKPDVIVMDVSMPDLNGLEAARRIHKALPKTGILILTMHYSDQLVRDVIESGARGYILKNAMDLDLVSAIKKIAEGKMVVDPQIKLDGTMKGERDTGLTPRELEILQHIVAGKSNKEIALDLKLSANTVSVHRANIMDALGIHKTAELVVYAIRNGLVTLP